MVDSKLKGWYNKPDKKVVIRDAKIIMRAPRGTDCWLKTKQGLLQQSRSINNAPFHWQKATGNFNVLVKISGGFSSDGDKAGIMLRCSEDEWIFAGMEYYNQTINAFTSVAIEHSDWSIAPLPEKSEKAGVWFCVKRDGDLVECLYSLDAMKWVQTRQVMFTTEPTLYVGLACACPQGDEYRVTFENYSCNKS